MKKTITFIVVVLLATAVATAIGEKYIIEMTLREIILEESVLEEGTLTEDYLIENAIDPDKSYARLTEDGTTGEMKTEVFIKYNYGLMIANTWYKATDWCRDTAVSAGNAVVNATNNAITTIGEGWNNFKGWIGF